MFREQREVSRIALLHPTTILPLIPTEVCSHAKENIKGFNVRIASRKLVCFRQNGIICVSCGMKANFFALEKRFEKRASIYNYYLQLYGRKGSHDVLFTVDHIMPVAKGGSNKMENLQTMCRDCNGAKADTFKRYKTL